MHASLVTPTGHNATECFIYFHYFRNLSELHYRKSRWARVHWEFSVIILSYYFFLIVDYIRHVSPHTLLRFSHLLIVSALLPLTPTTKLLSQAFIEIKVIDKFYFSCWIYMLHLIYILLPYYYRPYMRFHLMLPYVPGPEWWLPRVIAAFRYRAHQISFWWFRYRSHASAVISFPRFILRCAHYYMPRRHRHCERIVSRFGNYILFDDS